jgi:hypothetical protein
MDYSSEHNPPEYQYMVFVRFSQAPFGEALSRFHTAFGFDVDKPVTK